MKLCGICLITNNVLRLSEFYKEIFQLNPVGDDVHTAFDEMQLAIWNPGNVKKLKYRNTSIMYLVDDAEYEYQRLKLIKNIKNITEPQKMPWGVKAFTFQDPDGNEVNLVEKL